MEINVLSFIFLAIGLVVGAFIGVGMGRRSGTANKVYDDARTEADNLRERLRLAEARLRARGE